MLSMLMMGFATNFWFALAARSIGGLLNGNVGVIQTMVGEMVKNPDHERKSHHKLVAETVWLTENSTSLRNHALCVVNRYDMWACNLRSYSQLLFVPIISIPTSEYHLLRYAPG